MSDLLPSVRRLGSGYKFEQLETGVTLRLDPAGRWLSYRCGPYFYRRCANGDVISGSGGGLLDKSGKNRLLNKIHLNVKVWLALWSGEHCAKSLLQTALTLTQSYYDELTTLYHKTYLEDVPILPPDRYGDLVVQPAVGCPNRACTFCVFYNDKPFKVMNYDSFDQHLRGIKKLMGSQVAIKDGLFIGSANAMALSHRRLSEHLDLIEQYFGTFKRGIAAFSDPDFAAPRSHYQWQDLANRGVGRLVIGLETGWGLLRGELGKSSNLTKVRQAVSNYKQAGISVGLTLLRGVCHQARQAQNREETLSFIESLELNGQDVIYLSPLKKGGGETDNAQKDLAAYRALLKASLTAKVVPYQMQRFHYFA